MILLQEETGCFQVMDFENLCHGALTCAAPMLLLVERWEQARHKEGNTDTDIEDSRHA